MAQHWGYLGQMRFVRKSNFLTYNYNTFFDTVISSKKKLCPLYVAGLLIKNGKRVCITNTEKNRLEHGPIVILRELDFYAKRLHHHHYQGSNMEDIWTFFIQRHNALHINKP